MTDIIDRLLDEAEKAQRKGHLVLAAVCRDASDQLGLTIEERDRLRDVLRPFAKAADDLDREGWDDWGIEGSLTIITAKDCRRARDTLREDRA